MWSLWVLQDIAPSPVPLYAKDLMVPGHPTHPGIYPGSFVDFDSQGPTICFSCLEDIPSDLGATMKRDSLEKKARKESTKNREQN